MLYEVITVFDDRSAAVGNGLIQRYKSTGFNGLLDLFFYLQNIAVFFALIKKRVKVNKAFFCSFRTMERIIGMVEKIALSRSDADGNIKKEGLVKRRNVERIFQYGLHKLEEIGLIFLGIDIFVEMQHTEEGRFDMVESVSAVAVVCSQYLGEHLLYLFTDLSYNFV